MTESIDFMPTRWWLNEPFWHRKSRLVEETRFLETGIPEQGEHYEIEVKGHWVPATVVGIRSIPFDQWIVVWSLLEEVPDD